MYNFLAANQQSLLCLIPGTWTRLCFHTVVFFMSSSTRLSAHSEQTKSCFDARQQCCQRRWTETSLPKHFNLWQLNVGDCRPPGISNNAPLFYLHFFPAGVFFPSPPSLPPSFARQMCPRRERERSRAPVMFAAWHLLTHYAPVTSLQKQSQGCDKRQTN